MKNKITLLLSLLCFIAHAQDPAIEWQTTIGGSASDVLNSMEPTADGGYILAGYSSSNISGDKTENSNGALDIWIVKISSSGVIQWQNTIGGAGDDFVNVVKQTSDGGYIVLAGSDSNISGDKTENSRGGLDYWILKLNASGTIVWQRTYGGANPDFDTFGQETADGGYIVGGYSDSGATGDKTEPSNGQRDYWILKLDSLGAIVWQNAIGGSLVDRVQATAQTFDGGYIVGGFSFSGISGDKTEANQGGSDYWIVKLSATGSIEWQNTIGGSASDPLRDLIQTADGGYLAGGYSLSNISGEKTENSNGDFDYWLIKLNSTGGIVWQNTIGGANTEFLRDLKQLADGSYLVAGYSNSNISGDKLETSNGGYDYWIVRVDTNGNITSQNSIGGATDESGPYILPTGDGGFVMGCSSDSNISGDKTENSEGLEDYWIFKVSAAILGVETNTILNSLAVYPNPTTGILNIDNPQGFEKLQVRIFNLLGQEVKAYEINSDNPQVEITGNAGIYFVELTTGTQKKAFKVIKQ